MLVVDAGVIKSCRRPAVSDPADERTHRSRAFFLYRHLSLKATGASEVEPEPPSDRKQRVMMSSFLQVDKSAASITAARAT